MESTSTGYLRAYDDDLAGVLELVVDDLCVAGLSRDDARAEVWPEAQARLNAIGTGAEAPGETALQIMDHVQDGLIYERRAEWPLCPEHGRHALFLPVSDADAMWTCPENGRRFARLGELAQVQDD